MFGTNFTTKDSQSFYNYYQDIAKRMRERYIDILLVVNMFLTGFDAPSLNTLYVDKNLKYHGLMQAFSRTNRLLNEKKSQGNIVCFRNLKSATDEAIALFSNKNAKETVIMKSYEEYLKEFEDALAKLKTIAPTIESVNAFTSEEETFAFIQAFRNLIRIRNVLSSFADYEETTLPIPPQEFEDYKSKYLDIYDSIPKGHKEKVSILEDVDFELELIGRDEITVSYILNLFAQQKAIPKSDFQKSISQLIGGTVRLRSKKALIEEFIHKYLDKIPFASQIEEEFYKFRDEKKKAALKQFVQKENLNSEKVQYLIDNYLFAKHEPRNEEIAATFNVKPKILEISSMIKRIKEKFMNFIDIFIEGI
jgi:type I restriction enzyme R subunit